MLRAQMDAAEYKHILLVLIFVKLTSGTFGKQQNKIREMMSDLKSEYCITEQAALYAAELAERDYHTEDNVFRVLQEARWEALRAKPDRPIFRSMIDNTMTATENDNKTIRGMLHKQFPYAQLGQGVVGDSIDFISTIGVADEYNASGFLGEV